MKHRISVCFAALALVAVASAQFSAYDHPFIEKRGTLEFSREMIVRPIRSTQSAARVSQNEINFSVEGVLGSNQRKYIPETDEYIVRVPRGSDENSYSKVLMDTGLFEYAVPNWICYPQNTPNDPTFPSQWHHVNMQSVRGWDYTIGSTSITIAVTDTGVELTHPDLAASMVPGYNAVDHLAQTAGGNVSPVHPHGTHVAGCATAIGNNGVGVAGVGWNFRIMPIRVSNVSSGGASYDALMEGARWAADHGAKVISASYSGVDYAPIQTTGSYIRGRNALYLYAAGNDSRDLNMFDWPDVIVVGASDSNDAKAGFSAYGLGVDVFSPGVGIWSSVPGGGYEAWNGTSMATPVCNGLCALIWSRYPSLTPAEVEAKLKASCRDLGVAGEDTYWGAGRIDVYQSVTSMSERVKKYATNGHYYERVDWPITWSDANIDSQRRSYFGITGHLASIQSASENAFITGNLGGDLVRSHWLGGFQPVGSPEPAGNWRWSSGEPWSYSNWNPGEPNNSGSGEDSLEYWGSGTLGGWNDALGATLNKGFIVEYDVPLTIPVSGHVTLMNYVASPATQSVTIEVRNHGSSIPLETQVVPLNAGGNFNVNIASRGVLDVAVKGSHWLRQTLSNVNLVGTSVSGLNYSLVNGDTLADNEVNLADYARLSAAFGSSPGDGNWNPQADLDGDGEVTLLDYSILSGSFGQAGDQ